MPGTLIDLGDVPLVGNFPSQATETTPGDYHIVIGVASNPAVTFVGPGTYNLTSVAGVLTGYTLTATAGAVLNISGLASVASTANLVVDGPSTISIGSGIDALSVINASFTGSGGGTLNIDPTALGLLNTKPVISGFGATDQIDFGSGSTTGDFTTYIPDGTPTNGGTLELKDAGGTILDTVTIKGLNPTTGLAYTSVDFGVDAAGIEYGCFNEGTAIATPAGEAAIESLQIGDLVITADGAAHPVKWLGYRSVDLRTFRNPAPHYLVRIKEGAFAPNMPRRDLLVTQEHCILADGGLIPARMLVNGRSIVLDRSITNFTYYHVELERHGILLAEGLPTESYLDTGNRGNFANADTVALIPQFALNAGHKSWADAAAPLTVDATRVEPVWRMLDARAQERGVAKVTADPVLTSDPDLNVVTGSGAMIRPVRNAGGKYLFMVPAGETDLRLTSRTARPSDIAGPFIDDRRDLGVLVGEIAVYDGRKKTALKTHLETAHLSGWFEQENATRRWTNGNARLPVDLASLRAPAAILEIQIVGAGPYIVEYPADNAAIAA
jgi:hypothetical protein